MRIELGTGGKIVGTRKVSPNGQVSGLKDLAGKEVLVLLPGEAEKGLGEPEKYFQSLEEIIREQIRQAMENALTIQKAYTAPLESVKDLFGEEKGSAEPSRKDKE